MSRGATLTVLCLVWALCESTAQGQSRPAPPPDCTLVQLRPKLARNEAPDMLGCDVRETAQNLRSLNRRADIRAASGAPPIGRIVAQSPPPGERLASGTVFDLSYADGNPIAEVRNVSVSMTLEPRGPYRSGQRVTYSIVIENAGPSASSSIRVVMVSANLGAITVTGGCTAFPCQTIPLPAGRNMSIFVEARIVDAGAFQNEVRISSRSPDQNPDDNVARIDEIAPPESPPRRHRRRARTFPSWSTRNPAQIVKRATPSITRSSSPIEARPPRQEFRSTYRGKIFHPPRLPAGARRFRAR